MCSWGWRSHFRVVIGGWLCLLEMLLLGALKWGLKGVLKETLGRVSRTQRGVRRVPERGEWRGGYFCLKVHSQSGICERCLYSGLGNHLFRPGIPRFLAKIGLRVQQFTPKVIVVTCKTFKLIVGFFETLSKNTQKPRKIKEKQYIQPLLEGD